MKFSSIATRFRSRDGPENLNEKAMKNMTIIAVMGIILLFMDLLISWHADGIKIVSDPETGKVFLLRPSSDEPAGHMAVRARVDTDKGSYEKDLDFTLSPYLPEGEKDMAIPEEDKEESEEERIMYELRTIASDLDSDRSRKRVILPMKLPGGETVRWSHRRESHTLLILLGTGLLIGIMYKRRLLPLEKKRKEETESIAECLPLFIHQLVLLLNAGLVLESAFARSVEENIRFEEKEERFFYLKMREIYDSIVNTNGSLHLEFQNFARESGVGELLRVSTVISDNVNRGTELTEKLERESESLWLDRKLKSEERGRLAETKMTLPLTVFLGVLIIITVAPALLEL